MATPFAEPTAAVGGAGAPATGTAMDKPLPKRPRPYWAFAACAMTLLGGIAAVVQWLPHGLRVSASDIRIAIVQQGLFHNDVLVRAKAEPLRTIMLDNLETGRVDEILVNDGALVEKGALLFRLSNPQLRLNMLAREAERAQQISNLSVLRESAAASQTEHERRLLDLSYSISQAEKLNARNEMLGQKGFIPAVALEESQSRLAQQRRALEDENRRAQIEINIKRDGMRQMEQAIAQLNDGLKVVAESIDALAVRAPIAGRLTDFQLQLGEIVKAEQRIGRIDDPSRFKLVAQIDEYFLGSILAGKKGSVNVNGHDYAVEVSRVFPQITDGRFSIELLFTGDPPREMSPGQSAETQITLGGASPALFLPNDAFVNDTGGTWVYVLGSDGLTAEHRAIRVGRRNNSQVEVASGLSAGERVVVSSYARFGKAQRLQIEN